MNNQGLRITLTGWKAVAVLAVVVGVGGFRVVSARASLDTQGRAALEDAIATRIQGRMMAGGSVTTEDDVRALLEAGEVEILSMQAHGSGEDVVVRVELEASPTLPAGTELVQYHRMEHGSVTGWRVRGETTAAAYWLAVL